MTIYDLKLWEKLHLGIPIILDSHNQDFKDFKVLCIFEFNVESHNSDCPFIQGQLPYVNHEQDVESHIRNLRHPP